MTDTEYLGEFEHLVLLAAVRLGDDAYGVAIAEEIEAETGRDVSVGSVYVTLKRLARKGYVSYEKGDPTPERGGRAKKFVRVDPAGIAALARSREVLDRLWSGVELPEPERPR